MSRDWEATLASWSAAPGTTEQTKCENAERAVRKAIDASAKLCAMPVKVFKQGSYANRTNVRQDSDVDICVLYTGAFFPNYSMSEGLSNPVLGFPDGTYFYTDFKNDVGSAMVSYFASGSVTRGNKAFDVHANTYRIDADVVPCFEHRRYMGTAQSHWFESGTDLHPDNGGSIVNWPQQNYDNGASKNDATGQGFKAVARILKRLRYELIDEGYTIADAIPSFLIECLVYEVEARPPARAGPRPTYLPHRRSRNGWNRENGRDCRPYPESTRTTLGCVAFCHRDPLWHPG